jgi:hypothetical protein
MEFIGIVPSDNRVIMKILASSLEDQSQPTSKPLRLSKALLRRVSSYTLHSNLMDSCLYVLSRWILELLESKEDSFVRCACHSDGATESACRVANLMTATRVLLWTAWIRIWCPM